MASFLGKLVQLQTAIGTYKGTITNVDVEEGRLMLEEVEFTDGEEQTTLPRIRIAKNDVINTIRILGEGCVDTTAVDTVSAYCQNEQLVSEQANSRGRSGFSRGLCDLRLNRSFGHDRPYARGSLHQNQWTMNAENVFPPDPVFANEREMHETQLYHVMRVSDMNSDRCYCVLSTNSGQDFDLALQKIGSSSNVGLSVFGCPLLRTTKPSWLTVSTPSGIFIFDIRYMGEREFHGCGLARFLTQPSTVLPRKLMHDSRFAADALRAAYNVELNIFRDTLAMQTCIVMRDTLGKIPRNAWSIIDLLYKYLPEGKDLDLLEHRFNFAQLEYVNEVWNFRPAKESVLHLAAALTYHIDQLDQCLLRELLKPVEKATQILLNSVRNHRTSLVSAKEFYRMPDGIGELSHVKGQWLTNPTGSNTRRLTAEEAYKKGLVRCKMNAFVATTIERFN